jgi:hypothetical protein
MNVSLELMKKDAVEVHLKTKLQRGQTKWGAPESKNPFDFETIKTIELFNAGMNTAEISKKICRSERTVITALKRNLNSLEDKGAFNYRIGYISAEEKELITEALLYYLHFCQEPLTKPQEKRIEKLVHEIDSKQIEFGTAQS